jgi:hypothetical protein
MKNQCISTCFPRAFRDQSDGISAVEISSREVPKLDERRLTISSLQFDIALFPMHAMFYHTLVDLSNTPIGAAPREKSPVGQ